MIEMSTLPLTCVVLWQSVSECEFNALKLLTSRYMRYSPHLVSDIAFFPFLCRETKTVNAWFQNKRASSKKRTRGVPYDLPHISSLMGSTSSSSTNHPRQAELDDFPDDDYSIDSHNLHSTSLVSPDNTRPQSSFYAGNPHHTHFLAETNTMPRRMRMRPTPEQTDELRNLYNVNPHPTTDQRQALSERIGM
jgi:hypothetical protein